MVRRGGGSPIGVAKWKKGACRAENMAASPSRLDPVNTALSRSGSLVEAGSQRGHQGCIPSNADKLLDFVHMRGQLFNDG